MAKTSAKKAAAKKLVRPIGSHETPLAVKGREPHVKPDGRGTPLIEMRDISIAFGGIKAVDHASIDLYPGEVVGLLGHNGAGKSTLIKVLSGAYKRDHGQININGGEVTINNPRDAKALGIETIYQTLALADNVDAAANLYLGRELKTSFGTLDDVAMEAECRKVMHRLNPNFRRFKEPVSKLSGGQRQSVAIARAIHFNARILIMDEPTAALGPQETAQVAELIKQLKAEGGEIPAEVNTHATALALQNLMLGLNVLCKVVRSEDELWLLARTTLKGLGLLWEANGAKL